MNKLNFTALLCLLFVLSFSCSKDDPKPEEKQENSEQITPNPEPEPEPEPEPTPTEPDIPLTDIDLGIEIENGIKIAGTPPSPTGILNFDIETDDQAGYLDRGFNITFSSSDNVAGAYILLKDENGTKSDSYFNVSFLPDTGGKTNRSKHIKKGMSSIPRTSTFAKMIGEQEINVLFDTTISPGNFCYEICLYDASNNISEVVTRCVNVLAWGGNTSIVGEWRFKESFENDMPQEDDNTSEINCNNGSVVTLIETLYEKEDWILSLQSDGDYFELYDEVFEDLDFEASAASCEAIYGPQDTAQDKFLGKWTYSEETGLSIIDFAYEDLLDASRNEVYEEGEIYFDGIQVEVLNGELVLTETEETSDGTITYKAVFEPNN